MGVEGAVVGGVPPVIARVEDEGSAWADAHDHALGGAVGVSTTGAGILGAQPATPSAAPITRSVRGTRHNLFMEPVSHPIKSFGRLMKSAGWHEGQISLSGRAETCQDRIKNLIGTALPIHWHDHIAQMTIAIPRDHTNGPIASRNDRGHSGHLCRGISA